LLDDLGSDVEIVGVVAAAEEGDLGEEAGIKPVAWKVAGSTKRRALVSHGSAARALAAATLKDKDKAKAEPLTLGHGTSSSNFGHVVGLSLPLGEGQQIEILPTGILVYPNLAKHMDQFRKVCHGRFHPKLDVISKAALTKATILSPDSRSCDVPCMVVDCRGPKEGMPPPRERLRGHVGMNATTVQQVLAHDTTVADIATQLKEQWNRVVHGHGPLYLVCFCKSGKHRAVAWAHILQALFLGHGFDANVNLTATEWAGTCSAPGKTCEACSKPWPLSLLNQAISRLSLI